MSRTIGSIFSRQWKVILIVTLLAASLVGSYAYFSSQLPTKGPRVSLTSFPIELTVGLDKTEYTSEENITIEFCVRNISNTTLKIMKSYSWGADPIVVSTESVGASIEPSWRSVDRLFHFGLSLAYGNGTEILRVSEGIMASVCDILLEPNGYIKQTSELDRGWGVIPLQVGTYEMRAIFEASLNGSSITLETPSIGFGIV